MRCYAPQPMIKLIFCLRRRRELSREEFQQYWYTTHAPLVKERAAKLGARRYVQLHTSHDDLNEVLRLGRGGPEPYDGVAELWFDDRAALESAFSTADAREAGAALLADERNFIDLSRSPIWLAEERTVVPG